MGIEDRTSAIADDPVGRLIRVHAASLARAARHAACRPDSPPCPPSDDGQCRIIINDLKREIDRLRRGVDRVDVRLVEPRVSADDGGSRPAAGDSYAVRSAGHKGYAPDPLGKAPPAPDDAPPTKSPRLVLPAHVTSIGSLLDVVA